MLNSLRKHAKHLKKLKVSDALHIGLGQINFVFYILDKELYYNILILFIIYEILGYKIKKDDIHNDILEYMIGFLSMSILYLLLMVLRP